MEGVTVLDFDMLCSTVALQTQGKWRKLESGEGDDEGLELGGGVFRMWEGEVLDCFEDRRVALQSSCCPCYRFGKNMKRAGFGSCFMQGTFHFVLAFCAFFSVIAFAVTKRPLFIYLAVAFAFSLGTYMGLFRAQIRKKFNIKGSDSSLDDCVYHFICPCCALCQVKFLLKSCSNSMKLVQPNFCTDSCFSRVASGKSTIFFPCSLPLSRNPELWR
ncbi:hypothetical protein EUGRSUZ_E03677 [Eucalyptus grandis]|uniref:Uncharacterized protein n=2 Tax=Eucalyptus grandis TaxID=71139 RepID=A0A059C9C6_EUCGR|nr:hypothetical protein EUGRSUZ_E03677 [Eucalyptus grandis]